MSNLNNLSTKARELHHFIRLNTECRLDLDLRMWFKFLSGWNVISFFLEKQTTDAADLQHFIDYTDTELGGFPKKKISGFKVILNNCQHYQLIAYFEVNPTVMTSVLRATQWPGWKIVFNCDKEATILIINKDRSNIPIIMKYMRRLTLCSLPLFKCYKEVIIVFSHK